MKPIPQRGRRTPLSYDKFATKGAGFSLPILVSIFEDHAGRFELLTIQAP